MEAFVYCWTDHKTNKLYVGSHKGSIDDGYVCSSKPMLEQYRQRPDDFTRQILAHGTHIECRVLEAKILDSVNAKMDESFYNMHNGNGEFYFKKHTEEAKRAIGIGNSKNKRPDLAEKNRLGHDEDTKKRIVVTRRERGYFEPEANPMYGKKHTDDAIAAMKAAKTGDKNPMYGKKLSEETRARMSEARRLYWQKKKEQT